MSVEDMVVEDLRRQLAEAQRDVVGARNQGWRDGMEEAAKICETLDATYKVHTNLYRDNEVVHVPVADEIRKQIEEG